MINLNIFTKKRKKMFNFTCYSNMLCLGFEVPGEDDLVGGLEGIDILIEFTNQEKTSTTIKCLELYYCEKWYHYFNRKRWKEVFIDHPKSLPSVVDPGEIWQASISQDEKLKKMARDGYLYIFLFHSKEKKGIKKRIKISPKIGGYIGIAQRINNNPNRKNYFFRIL